MALRCRVCGRDLTWSGRGRQPAVCGQRCRKRLSRSTLPASLTDLHRWCARDGKRPVRVNGAPASSTDPSTWHSYATVQSVPHGVMLGDGLACWDLDNVINEGVLHKDAVDVLDDVTPLWVERSMSGAGLHVFVHGDGRSHQGEHVSYYSHSRFIAVTGDRYWLPR